MGMARYRGLVFVVFAVVNAFTIRRLYDCTIYFCEDA